ncbi:MAG: hypothetical protein D6690_17980 [Nitrospirae bacterium]|nr:MAG: hypothetical protein D6690_17980 [Nitrospirota bacterium]
MLGVWTWAIRSALHNKACDFSRGLFTDLLKQYRDFGMIGLHRDVLPELLAQRLLLSRNKLPALEPLCDSRYARCDGQYVLLPAVARQWERVRNCLAWNQTQLVDREAESDPVEVCLARRYSVITGSAGSGKTAMLKRLADRIRARGWTVAATAMTGKAASLLGPEGQTLHRYLGFGPGGFQRAKKPDRVVIVDEASMLTLSVLEALMRAAPDAHLVFAGDRKQLPPVQGIAVFDELCRKLPTIDLDRRSEATVVRQRCPLGPTRRIACRTEQDVVVTLSRWVSRMLPEGSGWQVLAPVYDGPLGIVTLNRHLQTWCNPHGEWLTANFRRGDRVIVEENRYEGIARPVFNGQTGRVMDGTDDGCLLVEFDCGSIVAVPPSILRLAYCLSIHKAQGSRYRHVLVVWPARQFPHLERDPSLHRVATTRATEETLVLAA